VSAANAGNKGAPSSPRSSSVRRVGFKVVPTSTLLATRHLQPCPCIVAFRSPLVPRCARPAIMPRPPKVSRSMFRCSGSSHRAEISRYPRRARSTPGSRFAFVPVMDRARLPRARPALLRRYGRAGKSVRRHMRHAKKESLRAPPKAVFTSLRRRSLPRG